MAAFPFQALIFDLDGTLADSLADIADAMNGALAASGLPVHALAHYRLMVGEGVKALVQRALPPGDVVHFEAVFDAYRAHYQAIGHARTFAYPGIAAMLDALTALGVPMAVLSNKRDDFTRALVAQRFGRWRFVEVRGEREGVPRKPDPTAALELALALCAAPERIGFVGDTAIDMQTARAAGMTPIGVLWGFRGRDELVANGAVHLLETPLDLLALR